MKHVKYSVRKSAQLVLVKIKWKGHCGWLASSQGQLESLLGSGQLLGCSLCNPLGGPNPAIRETVLQASLHLLRDDSLKSLWPPACLVPGMIKAIFMYFLITVLARRTQQFSSSFFLSLSATRIQYSCVGATASSKPYDHEGRQAVICSPSLLGCDSQ